MKRSPLFYIISFEREKAFDRPSLLDFFKNTIGQKECFDLNDFFQSNSAFPVVDGQTKYPSISGVTPFLKSLEAHCLGLKSPQVILEPSLDQIDQFFLSVNSSLSALERSHLAGQLLDGIRSVSMESLNAFPIWLGDISVTESSSFALKLQMVAGNWSGSKIYFLDYPAHQSDEFKKLTSNFYRLHSQDNVRSSSSPASNLPEKVSFQTVEQAGIFWTVEDHPTYFLHQLEKKALASGHSILLPEGNDLRVIEAASRAVRLGLNISLLGDRKEIEELATKAGLELPSNLGFVRAQSDDEQVDQLYQLRKKKGISRDTAKQEANTGINLASLLLRSKCFGGVVGGVVYTSAEVLRSALRIVGLREKDLKIRVEAQQKNLASSFFLMMMPEGVKLFADCAVNIDPDPDQLAEIAWETAMSAGLFLTGEVRVAFISYGTFQSAGETPQIDKIKTALDLIKKRAELESIELGLKFFFDGPLQYDAAVDPKIARKKAPDSQVAGRANVLIFPNLETGNSVYKAVQQSAKILSIGPILQGFQSPINDLSRGATPDDIFYTILVTSIQNR